MKILKITAICLFLQFQITDTYATFNNFEAPAELGEQKTKKKNKDKKDVLNYQDIEVNYNRSNYSPSATHYVINNPDKVNNYLPIFTKGDLATYIRKNMQTPKEIFNQKIQGKVYVGFVIDEKGEMIEINVAKGVHPLLDKLAVYQIMQTKGYWKPGLKDGKPCTFSMMQPISLQFK
ncbi:MAG: energy transducer TonB [Marinifilaceae bacterium]